MSLFQLPARRESREREGAKGKGESGEERGGEGKVPAPARAVDRGLSTCRSGAQTARRRRRDRRRKAGRAAAARSEINQEHEKEPRRRRALPKESHKILEVQRMEKIGS